MNQQQLAALDALSDSLTAAAAAVRTLRASWTPAPPAPVPSPTPAPAPAPTPAPPPVEQPSGLVEQAQNSQRLVFFDMWHHGGPYQRYQELLKWRDKPVLVQVRRETTGDGPSFRPAKTYTLMVDDQPAATLNAAEGERSLYFPIDPTKFAPGWHKLDVAGLSDGETCPTYFAFRFVPGMQMPETMPVVSGSYELSEGKKHGYCLTPARYKPRPEPLPRKTYQPFSHAETKRLRTDLVVPGGHASVFLPNVDADGVVSTFNMQSYYWKELIGRTPKNLLLDGPRGVGTHAIATHIDVGVGTQTADPNSTPRLNVYICEPSRVIRVTEEGHITTLAGVRHKGIGSYYNDPTHATLELVGDWSAVPEERRGFWELWGMAWDKATLTVDPNAAPIPSEDNRVPHDGNPVAYVTDSRNNRVCKLTFDGKSHATPVKVTEFVVGMSDPWDVVMWRDEIIVSERFAHRVVAFNRKGEQTRVIVERDHNLPDPTVVDPADHRLRLMGTREQAHAHPILGPEGLYILDNWLYIGGQTQAQIRRVHLVTGALQHYMDLETDGNSHFIKFAMSDGTTGPKGTVFYQAWSNTWTRSADMSARLPDGSLWPLSAGVCFNTTGYGSAVGVGGGRIYTSSSEYGLRKKYLGDPLDSDRFTRGAHEFDAMRGDLLWGPFGFYGDESRPLPWGKSADLDYYLETCGHLR